MSEDWNHIEISDHGTIVVLRPFSEEAIVWFEANVGPPEPGGIYTCEPRLAQDILRGAAGVAGLAMKTAVREGAAAVR